MTPNRFEREFLASVIAWATYGGAPDRAGLDGRIAFPPENTAYGTDGPPIHDVVHRIPVCRLPA